MKEPITSQKFREIMLKNTGKADAFTYEDLVRGVSIPKGTLQQAKRKGHLVPLDIPGKSPVFSFDSAFKYIQIAK